MELQIFLPQETFLDERVDKITAESPDGSFCLKPRHIDFTSALAPGIVTYVRSEDGREVFVAVDEGILVKAGERVRISVRRAVSSSDLSELHETVRTVFQRHTEHEERARSALARLEAGFVRRFIELDPER